MQNNKEREIYNANTFFTKAGINMDSNQQKSYQKYVRKYFRLNKQCLATYMTRRLPIVVWLRKYKFKKYFLKDILAGATAGVIQIAPSKFD